MDYRKMFDPNEANKDFMFSVDLNDREHTVEIVKVEAGALTGENGRKTKKPVLSFKGARKKLAINKTNGKIIAKLYGKDCDAWVGKRITIYPTTTNFGGETVDCIRVKPHVPKGAATGDRDMKPDDPPAASTLPAADLTPAEIAELERLEAEEAKRGQ